MSFPTSPSTGNRYTLGNTQYEFNGVAWDIVGTVSGNAVEEIESRVTVNEIMIETNKSGDATQTFKVANAINADEAVNKAQAVMKNGDTMTGALTNIEHTIQPISSADNGRLNYKRSDGTKAYDIAWNYSNDTLIVRKFDTDGTTILSNFELDGGIGVNQSWIDETANREVSTTYTNSTNKPIVVSVSNNYGGYFYVDGNKAGRYKVSNTIISMTIIVPSGSTYKFEQDDTGGTDTFTWFELK